MKKLMFLVAVGLVTAPLARAATYYVDALNGNDDWSGTAEVAAADVQSSLVGPKRTLAAIMTVATAKNDVVIALPGEYKEGVSNPEARGTSTTLNRVTIPANVTLKSRDGRDRTFIIGAPADSPDARGCGVNATRCVSCGSGSIVQGFTITGGRTSNSSSNEGNSGGGVSQGNVIDCVITNNACAYRGGGTYYAKCAGCRFADNSAGSAGALCVGESYYNCHFSTALAHMGSYYNCTFTANSYPRGGTCYNCLVMGTGNSSNNNPKFYNCYHVKNYATDTVLDDDCVIFDKAATIKVDANGCPTDATSPIVNAGAAAYYDAMLAWAKDHDADGLPRVQDAAIDIGAFEYNPCADFSALLSTDGAVEVTVVSSQVTVAATADALILGPNQSLSGQLNVHGSDESTLWTFVAAVTGTGSLQVFFAGAETPFRTLTEADGETQVSLTAAESAELKLVYAGMDGCAKVSRFANVTKVDIEIPSAGVAIEGDITAAGAYEVAPGESLTFTVSRAEQATKACLGLEINGTFVSFEDCPEGRTFTVVGNDRTTAVSIKAVYDEGATTWFVDPIAGDDDRYCGLYADRAFKTLARAAAMATQAGEKILAAPGVYNEGGMYDASLGSNRVIVAEGVLLESTGGAGVTTIEGKVSEADGNANGCGPDSMRAVLLRSGAVLKGFTVTKGRPLQALAGGNNGNGGGLRGGMAVECVFANNLAAYRGNAVSASTLLRCYVGDDPDNGGFSCYSGITMIDCVHDNSRSIYSNVEVYNSTFIRGTCNGTSTTKGVACNCIFYAGASASCNFFNCRCVSALRSDSANADGRSQFSLAADEFPYEVGTYRPLKGSKACDVGVMDYYVSATNGWSALWQSFVAGDYAGGQRVYNGTIDIGAGEYDWRGDFAKSLATKGVVVESAAANVTANVSAGVDVPAGGRLKMQVTLGKAGRVSFVVCASDDAIATVLVDGAVQPLAADGTCAFEVSEGVCSVDVSVTGTGAATVADMVLPQNGLLVILK